MARISACLTLVAALAAPAMAIDVDSAVLKAEADRIKVVQKARAATVAIFGNGGRGGGSGVCISADGFVLSNFHVTKGAGNAMKIGMADGRLYDAVIVGIDPTGDVALVKLLGRDDFPHAPLGDSDRLRAGDRVFAMGNPFLLANDFQATVTFGIVSGMHRYQYPSGTLLEYADCIQTDASINPGNSGGPLFNDQGQVVGINGRGSFEKRGRVNVGVGYAISINQIKNFLGYLKSGRIVDHATLGAQVATDEDGHVLVTNILDSADAYRRGLRYGDELAYFGGRPIGTTNAFKNVLGIFPRGWRVPMIYRHGGETIETHVRLAGVHREGELAKKIGGGGKRPATPRPGAAKGGMPAIVKKHYEARDGYMNYYFNRIAQERISKGLLSQGDFSKETGKWTILAEAPGGFDARFELEDSGVLAVLPGGRATLAIDSESPDLQINLDPPGSGGMFAALHLWRRLHVTGVEKFGQSYYLGTMPLAGHQGLVDCLVGVHGGVESRFMCDPKTGRLLAMEVFADEGDPCELIFSDYHEVDGRQLPRHLEVRVGERTYADFKLTEFQFDKAVEG